MSSSFCRLPPLTRKEGASAAAFFFLIILLPFAAPPAALTPTASRGRGRFFLVCVAGLCGGRRAAVGRSILGGRLDWGDTFLRAA